MLGPFDGFSLRVSSNLSKFNSPLLNCFERSTQQRLSIKNPFGGFGGEFFSTLATSSHLPSYSWPFVRPEMSVS